MTLSDLNKRISMAIAVLTGRVPLPPSVTNILELDMALDQLKALVTQAQADFARFGAKAQDDAAARADLQQKVDNLEQDAIAAVQPLATDIANAAPEPPATQAA